MRWLDLAGFGIDGVVVEVGIGWVREGEVFDGDGFGFSTRSRLGFFLMVMPSHKGHELSLAEPDFGSDVKMGRAGVGETTGFEICDGKFVVVPTKYIDSCESGESVASKAGFDGGFKCVGLGERCGRVG